MLGIAVALLARTAGRDVPASGHEGPTPGAGGGLDLSLRWGRANVLLLLDEGPSRTQISQIWGVGVATVGRVKRGYREEGLDGALYEQTRSGRPVTFGLHDRKKIIALACTDPPEGQARWTLRLLAEHCGLAPQPSRNTVSLILKEDGIKPWRKKNVVRSRA